MRLPHSFLFVPRNHSRLTRCPMSDIAGSTSAAQSRGPQMWVSTRLCSPHLASAISGCVRQSIRTSFEPGAHDTFAHGGISRAVGPGALPAKAASLRRRSMREQAQSLQSCPPDRRKGFEPDLNYSRFRDARAGQSLVEFTPRRGALLRCVAQELVFATREPTT